MSTSIKHWIPNQHGAWAMLAVPFAAAVILRARVADVPAWTIPLAVLWLVGYLLFNAVLAWRKTAPARRQPLRAPLICYSLVCLVAGVAILMTGGLPLALWIVLFAPLVVAALVLAAHKRERSVLSGLTTVGAACLVFFVVRCGGWPLLAPGTDVWIGALLYGYFGGTVFHVKALIRGRRDAGSARAGLIWHGAWLVVALLLGSAGLASWWWTPFFALLMVRTAAMKHATNTGHVLRPALIGFTEVALSVVALVICMA